MCIVSLCVCVYVRLCIRILKTCFIDELQIDKVTCNIHNSAFEKSIIKRCTNDVYYYNQHYGLLKY